MNTDELLDTADSMLGDAIQMLSEVHQRLGITDDAAWGQTPMGHMRALRKLIQNERPRKVGCSFCGGDECTQRIEGV